MKRARISYEETLGKDTWLTEYTVKQPLLGGKFEIRTYSAKAFDGVKGCDSAVDVIQPSTEMSKKHKTKVAILGSLRPTELVKLKAAAFDVMMSEMLKFDNSVLNHCLGIVSDVSPEDFIFGDKDNKGGLSSFDYVIA